MKLLFKYCAVVLVICMFFISCKKDTFITSSNANLILSRDSIKFDTVFTTAGSVTQSFKIINGNNQKLLLSKIQLGGGSSSSFKININGNPSVEESDVEIAPNDSMYVFVSVFINPGTTNLPFIVNDSILISFNGNNRYVQLQAFGQNAHFLNDAVITSNTTWTNDLPYVILGGLQVDTGINLSIGAGCRIYAHADAAIRVDGTLTVSGTKPNNVVFTGDRLDEYYRDLPASWQGIYFGNNSLNNVLTFAVIKNAKRAVIADNPSLNSNPKLLIHQCVIDNAFEVGLFAYNSSIDIDNSLVSNCGNNIIIQSGGSYNFTNCTVASFSNTYLLHTNPVLQVTDAGAENGTVTYAPLDASFTNCILWGDNGSVDDEVFIDRQGSTPFNVLLQNCLYKAINTPSNATLNSVIVNLDPMFDSIDVGNKYYDFRITKNLDAPGINMGTIVAVPKDLDDNPRNVNGVDLGSYEKQ